MTTPTNNPNDILPRLAQTSTADLFVWLEARDDEYYNHTATVSDQTYDLVREAAEKRDPQNDYFQHHGAAPTSAWDKYRHNVPMGSLNKSLDGSEMVKWYMGCLALIKAVVGAVTVFITEKLDGASLSLYYLNGALVRGVTRGRDGIGEDITRNVKRMKGVPHRLAGTYANFTGHVRGEVMIRKADLLAHFKAGADARSTANGTMKRQSDAGPCKYLTVLCYQMLPDQGNFASKEAEFLALQEAGFQVPHYSSTKKITIKPGEKASDTICRAVEHVYQEYILTKRTQLDYIIDGLVIYIDDNDQREMCGEENHNPKGATALKFPKAAEKTILRSIQHQVGQSGRVTPVAFFDPVNLVGTKVKQATLHNYGHLGRIAQLGAKRSNLAVGDGLLVAKAGDVIPSVESLVDPVEKQPASVLNPNAPASDDLLGMFAGAPNPSQIEYILTPTVCPECQTVLIWEGEYLVCPNKTACPAQTMGMITRWLSEIEVLEWGDTLVEALIESGKVKDPSDLYRLTVADMADLLLSGKRRQGESKSQTCYDNLHAKKDLPLDLFVGSLGIPMWSRSMMQFITQKGFDSLGKLTTATVAEITAVKGVGKIKAEAFVAGFRAVYPLIYALLDAGVAIVPPLDGPLKGTTIAFTGFRDADLKNAIEAAGGTYKDSYSKSINYLVARDATETSAKLTAARKNGTKVIGIDDMWTIIGGKV